MANGCETTHTRDMKRVVGIWALVYLVLLWMSYAGARQTQALALQFPSRWTTLAFAAPYTAMVLAPVLVVIVMSGRHRIRRDNLHRTLPLYLLALVGVECLSRLFVLWLQWVGIPNPFPITGPELTVAWVARSLFTFALLVAFVHGFRAARELRENDRRALELEAELSEAARLRAEAELRAMTSQLNPRLMGDALDRIASLIRTAPDRAEQAIAELGDVVNGALRRDQAGEPPPDEDLDRAGHEPEAPRAASDSVLRRELLRLPLTLLALIAFYRYDQWSDMKLEMERRVYGPELPSVYFELRAWLGALILTIIVLLAVEMGRRVPWTGTAVPLRRKLLLHGAATLIPAALLIAKNSTMYIYYGLVPDTSATNIARLTAQSVVGAMVLYAVAAAINFTFVRLWHGLRGYRQELRLKARVSETQRRRAEAELRALEAELNPHFLGNALHTVAGLIRSSPDQATHVLAQLCLLMGEPVTRAGAHEVSVAEELAMLHPYLEVERARIRRPLTVRWNVAPETLAARVPRMMLQPLVENAIRHGLATQSLSGSGGIELCVRRSGMRLEIAVSDDGSGDAGAARPASSRRSPRVGVANTRARLRELYGDDATFDLDARAEGGMVARVSIPWREARDAVPPPPPSPVNELVPA
jgi:hypothetical protein